MKKIRLRTIFFFTLAVLAGTLLLHTSQNVQKEEERLAAITGELTREEDSIRLLKTEWAYLNSPGRLETLARQYLNLAPSDPAHIKTDSAQIPLKPETIIDPALQARPVSYVSSPPKKPSPKIIPLKAAPQEKTFDDLLRQVAEEGPE